MNNKKKSERKNRTKGDQQMKNFVRTEESAGAVIWRCSVNKAF